MLFRALNLEDRDRITDFVGHHEERFAVGTFLLLDEEETFGRQIRRGSGGIRRKLWGLRVGDIVDHDSAGTLKADEGVGSSGNFPQGQSFRLRTFIVASGVERVGGAVGIET